MATRKNSLEHALEEAVSRALRDNLAPLQRTADELQQAYADLVAACSSSRPSNALPALLRAQTSAAALAAGLSVLSNFVAVALNPREEAGSGARAGAVAAATAQVEEDEETSAPAPAKEEAAAPHHVAEAEPEYESEWAEEPAEMPTGTMVPEDVPLEEPPGQSATTEIPLEPVVAEPEVVAFDVASLPSDMKELHRRANRAAKVSMQDIKLLRPKEVKLGREHKDICHRLRGEIDKARKEYDRRFRAIQDHPVDYFHHWMVEILGEGDSQTLGEYPYPSPVLRH
ncbi:MAG: hypothetical protein WCD49_02560 [Candidatus Acidiferrales bacterium]